MFRKSGKVLFNDNWQFILKRSATKLSDILNETKWKNIEVPHDWLISDTRDLYATGEGWYKKTLNIFEDDIEKSIELAFDGVYMNSTVYVNGVKVIKWKYGYTPFYVEISDYLKVGENTIFVSVFHESPNSRWYSGAGIQRNVYLIKQNKTHITSDGVYINAGKNGEVRTQTDYCGDIDCICNTIIDKFGNATEGLFLENPVLWTLENPELYTLKTELIKYNEVVDCVYNDFGFRTIEFSADRGFILNGEPIKLKGVCQHHDLGALGAAVNVNAIRRQLDILKSMGVNAIRTAHNPPAAELIELCDEMGILVIDEFTDIWELYKTEYDYARFFPKWHKKDVEAWVKRDRNHPCVIMWSIGNEIFDTHVSERGLETAKSLCEEIQKQDPLGNAETTIGSNFMMGKNAQKVSDFLKHGGYNYGEQLYDEHHKKYPDWFIYGSETTSTVRSRGIYRFPIDTPLLTDDDMQCSDLGNSVVGWGKSNEVAWIMDRDRTWCGGQFVWTGFDYIGEPTPYSTKNSYFGAIDTAGLPKASYYFYKAVWSKSEPFVKIFPHWDWNEGQIIDVITYSNVETVELFLNGQSLGKQTIDFKNGGVLHGQWRVKYTKGELVAKVYDNGGNEAAFDRIASFGEPVTLRAQTELYGGLTFITISAYDKHGEFVANARNRVAVKVGSGLRLLGLDNGDSTDYDRYKCDNPCVGGNRRLFSGKLVAIIQGEFKDFSSEIELSLMDNDIPSRKIELTANRQSLDKDNPTAELTAVILPYNADYKDVEWKCVFDNGILANIVEVVGNNDGATVTAKGDGNFRVRAYCRNGSQFPQIISELEMTVRGMGIMKRSQNSFAVFTASSCDKIYGDSYDIDNGEGKVNKIGNNVVLEFNDMDFGEGKDGGATSLTIRGATMNEVNSIRLNCGGNEQLIEFKNSYCFTEQTFKIEKITGKCNVSFTFLPGSSFDFSWFKFNVR